MSTSLVKYGKGKFILFAMQLQVEMELLMGK
jgi:hypothetical protein